MRCVGYSSGPTGAAQMADARVLVCTHDDIEIQFNNRRGEVKRKIAMDDPDAMLDLAHQLIGAVQMIKERNDAKVLSR